MAGALPLDGLGGLLKSVEVRAEKQSKIGTERPAPSDAEYGSPLRDILSHEGSSRYVNLVHGVARGEKDTQLSFQVDPVVLHRGLVRTERRSRLTGNRKHSDAERPHPSDSGEASNPTVSIHG